MQLSGCKIGILSKDRVLVLSMHLEDISESHGILRRKDVPLGTPRRSIALLGCKHTHIDSISEITVESC
jgi:hypothetical protein